MLNPVSQGRVPSGSGGGAADSGVAEVAAWTDGLDRVYRGEVIGSVRLFEPGFAWGGLPCRGGLMMVVSRGRHCSIRVVLCQGESGSGASLGARDGLVPDVMMSHGVLDAGLSRCVDACLTGWSVPYGMG